MSKCLYIASDDCKKYFPTYNEKDSYKIHQKSKELSNDFFSVSAKHIPATFYLIWWGAASWKSTYIKEIIKRNEWDNWKDNNQWWVYIEWSLSNYDNLVKKIEFLARYNRKIEIHYIMPKKINEAYYLCLLRNRRLKDQTFIRTHIESAKTFLKLAYNYNNIIYKLFISKTFEKNERMVFDEKIFKNKKEMILFLEKNMYNETWIKNIVNLTKYFYEN